MAGSIDRGVRDGRLFRVLPGVYCATGTQEHWSIRVRAAAMWAGPNAVVTGRAAAKLSFWASAPLTGIRIAVPGHRHCSVPWLYVEQRRVPPEFVLRDGPIAITAPALTAVDLIPELGGEVIDLALRTSAATLDQMWDAWGAAPRRNGNAIRKILLHDSRDHPWSEAERLQHRLLRSAGIRGWRANRWIYCGESGYIVDVRFKKERLVLEVDGWEVHGEREAFESDRRRRNHLVLARYDVLNFTFRQLRDDPDWVIDCVRTALGSARTR